MKKEYDFIKMETFTDSPLFIVKPNIKNALIPKIAGSFFFSLLLTLVLYLPIAYSWLVLSLKLPFGIVLIFLIILFLIT